MVDEREECRRSETGERVCARRVAESKMWLHRTALNWLDFVRSLPDFVGLCVEMGAYILLALAACLLVTMMMR